MAAQRAHSFAKATAAHAGRAAQADHKNAARPEVVALPKNNSSKSNKVELGGLLKRPYMIAINPSMLIMDSCYA